MSERRGRPGPGPGRRRRAGSLVVQTVRVGSRTRRRGRGPAVARGAASPTPSRSHSGLSQLPPRRMIRLAGFRQAAEHLAAPSVGQMTQPESPELGLEDEAVSSTGRLPAGCEGATACASRCTATTFLCFCAPGAPAIILGVRRCCPCLQSRTGANITSGHSNKLARFSPWRR